MTRLRRPCSPLCARWLLLVVLAACLPAARPDDLLQGEILFRAQCAVCHGPKGEGGRGPALTGRLERGRDEASLIRVITEGIPGTEMPRGRLGAPEIRNVAAWIRKLGTGAADAPTAGPVRGEDLFRGKGECLRCHSLETRGGVLGPDLADVGARRSADYLRRALLEPDADVPDSFAQYRWYTVVPDNFLKVRAVTRDGRRITGSRLNEDPFSIQVRDLDGRVISLFKSDLAELRKDWGKSLMPSYRDRLSPQELDALVGYLTSLKGRR
jgi:putative heme-binding domain-containing protein